MVFETMLMLCYLLTISKSVHEFQR